MTILANTYQTAIGTTSVAVTVPYQTKPFLGIIFVEWSAGTASLSPSWGSASQSSGAGGGAAIYEHEFTDPVSPSDTLLTPTVSVTTAPILVIALSISSDETDAIYNVSRRQLTTNTAWNGATLPATGNITESSADADDIEILGFVSAFCSNITNGSATVAANGSLAEVAEVDTSGDRWAAEVCRETSLPSGGSTQTVTVDGTGSGGTPRVSGFTGTWYIQQTFARALGGWSVGFTRF